MPWSSRPRDHAAPVVMAGMAVLLALLVFDAAVSGFSEEKRLSVYSGAASYSVPVREQNGAEYVGLLEILEPLGSVSARTDGGLWRLSFNRVDSEFTPGQTRVRVQGKSFDLPANFWLENGHGLVPLSSLPGLMQRFLGTAVNFHETSRRLFIGNVAVHFTAQVNRTNPPTLVMNFTAPVNPMIATEPGKLRMVFTREPLVPPGSQTLTFDSPAIPSATFQESNGAAEIAVNGPVPLFASFSNNGRTITITPAPQSAPNTQALAPPPAVAPGGPAPQVPPGAAPPAAVSSPVQYFVVLDASHGGDERGAALNDQLAEKDVTLAFGLRLRQQLQAHGFSTLVLREGDTTMSLDQRANMTNAAHPAIYICLHATSQGTGIRLYTALLPVGGENQGPFVDWNTAQSGFRAASQTAVSSLATELGKRQIAVRSLFAPLRPLNNIAAAAVAIEIAPPSGKVEDLSSPAYLQLVAESVTAGIEAVRNQLGGAR
ncbi:MAG: N-acetylmuramoyl-L-alanine amidase [Acidobacteriia bacterium]|nr:N-acetylmuramoyl-L-alanine amidase [Terriglobia bacterium]